MTNSWLPPVPSTFLESKACATSVTLSPLTSPLNVGDASEPVPPS